MLAYWLATVWPSGTRAIKNEANGRESLPCFCLYRQQYSNSSTLQLASIGGGDAKVDVTFFPAILPGCNRGKVLRAGG